MRCGTAERWLSDDLDRALAPRKRAKLETHLRTCSACRAYRESLVRLQAGALPPVERSPEYWAAFDQRLHSKLASTEMGKSTFWIPFSARRRWAWAAAGILVLAAAGIWYALLRPETAVMAAWAPSEDVLATLLQEAEADPMLERNVDWEIGASIEEMTPAEVDPDVSALADPLFWEGLSVDELGYIASELEKENDRGGPK